MSRDEILLQALALSAEDRAYVASVLENSLTDNGATPADELHDVDETHGLSGAELQVELHRRLDAIRSGATNARLASDVLADLKRRQASEPTP